MDTQDPAMSFFHSWVEHFAPAYEKVTVFCLYKGTISLPGNVSVFSLGKERYRNLALRRLLYLSRLLYFALKQRNEYDVVFVHMNQEYVLACGWLWKLLGKPVCLWYNHYSGSPVTTVAAHLCNKIFYTSRFAYTARYPHAIQMPVGVDIKKFSPSRSATRKPHTILFLGRLAPSKKLDVFISACIQILREGYDCLGSVYGPAISGDDKKYLERCKQKVLEEGVSDKIIFHDGVPADETPVIYASHDIFINCSQSGMYDKTLFEAAASGCIVLAASEDFRLLAGDEHYFDIQRPEQLSKETIAFLTESDEYIRHTREKMLSIAQSHSLDALRDAMYSQLQSLV